MENLIEGIFEREGLQILESRVFPDARAEYWHVVVADKRNFPISGGFASTREQARKISISELLERRFFAEIRDSSESIRQDWGLNIHPTACGFAGGFDLLNVIDRSIAEAAERWVMSLWIDEQFEIEEIPYSKIASSLDDVSKYLIQQFDSVRFFSHRISVMYNGQRKYIVVAQTMGFKNEGIFPGSSAQLADGNYWQHALVESYRHLLAVRNNFDRGDVFPDNKVRYFAKNAKVALQQIDNAKRKDWPEPRIILSRSSKYLDDSFFVTRTIFDGWKSWSEGPVERFLY